MRCGRVGEAPPDDDLDRRRTDRNGADSSRRALTASAYPVPRFDEGPRPTVPEGICRQRGEAGRGGGAPDRTGDRHGE